MKQDLGKWNKQFLGSGDLRELKKPVTQERVPSLAAELRWDRSLRQRRFQGVWGLISLAKLNIFITGRAGGKR